MNAGIPRVLDRLRDRYPSLLVDQIEEHEAGKRLVAVKNVTVTVPPETVVNVWVAALF